MLAVFKRVIISCTMLQLFKSHCNIMFSRDSIVAYASENQIQLKSVQLDSIENVLAKRDTIVVAKTGEGKSLIFQIATSMLNKTTLTTTIIISPLVALMKDQVSAAARWGTSVFVGSAQENKQVECHLEHYRFVFLSPEKLQQTGIQRELQRIAGLISLIVVDECHCQQSWQSFRAAFSDLPSMVHSIFGDKRPPLLLMTATLPRSMQDQMSSDFKLRSDTSVFRVSCDRDNLAIQIVGESDKIAQLVRYGRDSQSKGNMCLIYVATPSDCKSLAEDMKPNADDTSPLRIRVYHGTGSSGTSQPSDAEYMGETYRQAKSNELDVCICTSAFGMGIDKSNIDTVIHLGPPKSLSEYAQQIGRAGRDGSPAIAVMMFHPGKMSKNFSLWIANKNVIHMNQNFNNFQDMMSFVYSSQCRRKFVRKILEDVDDSIPLKNHCICDNCEEAHMALRNVAPAMKLLLSAIKEIGSPVCITRVADLLFGHAPKHKGAWDDTRSPLWGKGKEIFAPTKQNEIWNSLAAVAVHELKFVVASLHSHQAPPIGNVVAYQRLSVTPAGQSFLDRNSDELLVRERFVADSAFISIPPRCCSPKCTNKGVTRIGADLFCSKHSNNSGAEKKENIHQLNANVQELPSEVTSQPTSTDVLSLKTNTAVASNEFVRTASQCTPQTQTQTQTQDFPVAPSQICSQIFISQDPMTPQTTSQVLANQCWTLSKAGTYTFDSNVNPDAKYNPYMGSTYSRMKGNTHIKVGHMIARITLLT